MNPNDSENVTPEIDVPQEEVVEETPQEEVVEEEVIEEEKPEFNPEDVQKKIDTLTAQKNHYKEQLEKRQQLQTSVKASMSPSDLVAVMNAGVHQDDMERVERFAISEGLSIREAVANPELKAVLDVRQEQRNTAVATNVENVRRGVAQVTDEGLLSQARTGNVPDRDDDIERIVAAKLKNS